MCISTDDVMCTIQADIVNGEVGQMVTKKNWRGDQNQASSKGSIATHL